MNTLIEREAVQFILNGRTFDTATSSQVAVHRGVVIPDEYSEYNGAEQQRFECILYRTAKGNFFLHEHETIKYPKGKPVVSDEATEMPAEVAAEWISGVGAAIIDGTGLPLPESA